MNPVPEAQQGQSEDLRAVEEVARARSEILAELGKRIVGQREVIDQLLIALFARGHCLFVGVPGLAKTLLISSLSELLNLSFSRIQFTPDLMPADVTGTEIIEEDRSTGHRDFRFMQGPLFANVVLADEINRTPPKTQAALLEAMQERQVTVGRNRHVLPDPFFVLATQNPIEQEGTYPLPEAQLDRFLLRVQLGYPNSLDEIAVLERQQFAHPIDTLEQAISEQEILETQQEVKNVHVSPAMKSYMVEITRRTRDFQDVYLGASPRGSLTLFRTSQARAAIRGREFVLPDDVKALAESALCHRVILGPAARLRDVDESEVIQEILSNVPVPGGDVRREG